MAGFSFIQGGGALCQLPRPLLLPRHIPQGDGQQQHQIGAVGEALQHFLGFFYRQIALPQADGAGAVAGQLIHGAAHIRRPEHGLPAGVIKPGAMQRRGQQLAGGQILRGHAAGLAGILHRLAVLAQLQVQLGEQAGVLRQASPPPGLPRPAQALPGLGLHVGGLAEPRLRPVQPPGRIALPGQLPQDIPGAVGLLPAGGHAQVQIQQISHGALVPRQGAVAGQAKHAVRVPGVPGQVFKIQAVAGRKAAHIGVYLGQLPADGVFPVLAQGGPVQAHGLPRAAGAARLLRFSPPVGGGHIQGDDFGHGASFQVRQFISLPSSALISFSVKVCRVWQK